MDKFTVHPVPERPRWMTHAEAIEQAKALAKRNPLIAYDILQRVATVHMPQQEPVIDEAGT